jgi:hypothetical protein
MVFINVLYLPVISLLSSKPTISQLGNQKWPKLNTLEMKMAKITHPKIKQPSFGEKRPKFPDLRYVVLSTPCLEQD